MKLDLERAMEIAGRFDLARAVEALNMRMVTPADATSMDITGLEDCLRALALLHRKLGGWDKLREVLDTIEQRRPSLFAAPSAPPLDPALQGKLDRRVGELEVSVRLEGLLAGKQDSRARCAYIGEVVQKTEADFLVTKNFGRKPLKELTQLLAALGLSLNMPEAKGWTRPNAPASAGT